jgi:hypothetical protein
MAVGCCFIVLPGKRKGLQAVKLMKINEANHREGRDARKEKSATGGKTRETIIFILDIRR